MFPPSNICEAPSSEINSLPGDSSSEFDENAAARALLSFTTPPSSHGSPSRKRRRTSSGSAPCTGGFFPAHSGHWDGCPVHNGTGVEGRVAVSSTVPDSESVLDRILMARQLARIRASKALIESAEMKEAAGLLALLQLFPAPWCMTLGERVARHHDTSREAVNGSNDIDSDATEAEDSLEDEAEEQLAVSSRQEVEGPATDAPPISAKAAGKQEQKSDGPNVVARAHLTILPTATSRSSAAKPLSKRKSRAKGRTITHTTAKSFEFVNQTTSSIAAHKRKTAPPTPRKSASSGISPKSDEASRVASAILAGTLPTPPLPTGSDSVLDRRQRKGEVVQSKLSKSPEEIDEEEEERKRKQERTSKSGRTIKNTERWTTSGYGHG
ncbi:hypothetical protein MMC11_001337 [Xylographa trunciseda]|nr:hypothetical protein [Xylographa trunciseda]